MSKLSPLAESLILGLALELTEENSVTVSPALLAAVTRRLHSACAGDMEITRAAPKKSKSSSKKKKKSKKPRATSALQMYLKMADDDISAELQAKFEADETTIAGKSGDIPIYKVLKKTQELSTKMNYMAVSSHGGKMYAALSEEDKQPYIDAAEKATNARRAAASDGESSDSSTSSKKKKKKKSKKKKSVVQNDGAESEENSWGSCFSGDDEDADANKGLATV